MILKRLNEKGLSREQQQSLDSAVRTIASVGKKVVLPAILVATGSYAIVNQGNHNQAVRQYMNSHKPSIVEGNCDSPSYQQARHDLIQSELVDFVFDPRADSFRPEILEDVRSLLVSYGSEHQRKDGSCLFQIPNIPEYLMPRSE